MFTAPTTDQANSSATGFTAPFSDSGYSQGFIKTYKGKPQTLPQKIDVGTAKVAGTVLDMFNAPYELAGEAIAAPLEQRPMRAPTLFGGQNPENPISVVNKLLRAGAGAIGGIPSGTPLESARAAYNVPRGTMGAVEDTAMGLLMGKLAPKTVSAPLDAASVGASKLAKGASNVASAVGKKAIRVGLGPTEEAQIALANRPQDLARQTDFTGLSEKFAQNTNELANKLTDLDNQAWNTLSGLKAEPQSKLVNILKGVKQQFVGTGKTNIGNADRKAAAQIDSYIQRIKDIKQPGATKGTEQFLDQPQLKNIIQSIQKDANYSLPESDPVNLAVKAARAKIDAYLKDQNPDYEAAMKPVADATSALKDAVGKFRLERQTGGEYQPTGTTVSKLQLSVKDKRPEITRALDQIKNTTGIDFADEAKLTDFKQQFEPGAKAQGSRRVNLGRAIGGGVSGLLSVLTGGSVGTDIAATGGGGAIGGMVGGATDYYGGPMAKSIIQMLGQTKTGTGNVLSAVNSKLQGTPLQSIIQRLLQSEPILSPVLQGNQ